MNSNTRQPPPPKKRFFPARLVLGLVLGLCVMEFVSARQSLEMPATMLCILKYFKLNVYTPRFESLMFSIANMHLLLVYIVRPVFHQFPSNSCCKPNCHLFAMCTANLYLIVPSTIHRLRYLLMYGCSYLLFYSDNIANLLECIKIDAQLVQLIILLSFCSAVR